MDLDRRPVPPPARRPARRSPRAVGAIAATAVVTAVALLAGPGGGSRALAEVRHHQGFHATVLGWTSWYGSYGLGEAGTGWCIDHGLRAPDAAFGYVPTVVDAPVEVQRAIAWVAAAPEAGAVDAAARMLVFHDLMGATYPFGRLDLATLTTAQLAGFAGQEAAVLERARHLKADGLARGHLRPPLALHVAVEEVATGDEGRLEAAVLDADGQPVPGVEVTVRLEGGELQGPDRGPTLGDGRARWTFRRAAAPEGTGAPVRGFGAAEVPRLELGAWASSSVPAQRVAIGARDLLHGTAEAPPPTTTTTTAPPPTTTTTAPPPTTTTTAPPTTTTTTTSAPPSTTTTTTAPPPITPPPTAGPPTAPPPPPPTAPPGPAVPGRPVLPRTGSGATVGLGSLGLGSVLLGGALLSATRRFGRVSPSTTSHHSTRGG
jgi:hypothetical protein